MTEEQNESWADVHPLMAMFESERREALVLVEFLWLNSDRMVEEIDEMECEVPQNFETKVEQREDWSDVHDGDRNHPRDLWRSDEISWFFPMKILLCCRGRFGSLFRRDWKMIAQTMMAMTAGMTTHMTLNESLAECDYERYERVLTWWMLVCSYQDRSNRIVLFNKTFLSTRS